MNQVGGYLWKSILASSLLVALCTSCEHTKKKSEKLFEIVDFNDSAISFKNTLEETFQRNGLLYEYFYNGGGVAIGDFNNDELPDIYFVSNQGSNKLYQNVGNLKFEDVTELAGVQGKGFPTGVTTVDINNDEKLDIYVCKAGNYNNPDSRRNELFINMGNNKDGIPIFEERAKEYGLDLPLYSTQASFFDYDLDSDLDVFIINHDAKIYTNDMIGRFQQSKGQYNGDRLYKNENGYYKEVTKEAGLINNKLGFGLGIAIGDLNNDHWPDIYVSSDFSDKDHLYINDMDGTFTEQVNDLTNHISNFSMGNEISDFNNDGLLDIFTVDMVSEGSYGIKTSMSGMNPAWFYYLVELGLGYQYMFNTLQLNQGVHNGQPYFSEIAQLSGVSNTDWSWAPLFFDMDNDGNKDLFVSNGIKGDFRNNDFVNYQKKRRKEVIMAGSIDNEAYINEMLAKMPERKVNNYFYKNEGDFTFSKKTEWFSSNPTATNGAAYADFDNDGDLDLVVNNTDDPSYLIRNNSKEMGLGNYIKIRLKGPVKNTQGIGSRVVIKHGEKKQIVEKYISRGFQSAVTGVLHFGLGSDDLIDELKVIWPDENFQLLKNVSVNTTLVLKYTESSPKQDFSPGQDILFKDITSEFDIEVTHRENQYDDFRRESLLPYKLSQLGPALAVADVNGDGLDDFFVGGALNHTAYLYTQQENGSFRPTNSLLFDGENKYEDVGALFFDADSDNDQDLYVVSGGNEYTTGSEVLQDRLYINDGSGGFTKNETALPINYVSGSRVTAGDYDNDGDLDLFVGGRQEPGKYPYSGTSLILENIGNGADAQFRNVTSDIAIDLESCGMVTDASWIDMDNDNDLDLIVCGEWMSVKVFRNEQNRFEDYSEQAGTSNAIGWWNSLTAFDIDKDGDLDLIAGNLGLNYKYKASKKEPFEVYATDFDSNGTHDIVLGYYDDGNLVPLRGRECTSNQMPFVKKKFPTYDAFAKASLEEVLTKEKMKESLGIKATHFANSYFINDGMGHFTIGTFENLAQLSSVNQVLAYDFDGDKISDLVMAGNLYSSEVETPRNDASFGVFAKGIGSGKFKVIPLGQSGLKVEGEVRQMSILRLSGGRKGILFAKNNDTLRLIEVLK